MGRTANYPHWSEYVKTVQLPWVDIINDMLEKGYSLSKIAQLLGIPYTTMQRYPQGTEPKYSIGLSIITLHVRICGKELTDQRLAEAELTQLR